MSNAKYVFDGVDNEFGHGYVRFNIPVVDGLVVISIFNNVVPDRLQVTNASLYVLYQFRLGELLLH